MDRREFLKTALVTGAAISAGIPLEDLQAQEAAEKSGKTVSLPAKEVPIGGEYDVVVAGGGLAGVSAAFAAAKAGAKTLLIERNGFPGGVATAGMCSSVFNCLYTPTHEWVVRGNSALFVDRFAQSNGSGEVWRKHLGHIIFDTELGKVILTRLLQESGSDYLWDALVTDVMIQNNRVTGVIIDSKSGKQAIKAKAVVDATGDSDLAAMAGAPCKTDTFKTSYDFRLGNVNVDKFVQFFADNPANYPDYMDINWTLKDALAFYQATGTFLYPHGGTLGLDIIQRGVADGSYPQTYGLFKSLDAVQMHAIRDLGTVNFVGAFTNIDALDIFQISKALSEGKEIAYKIAGYYRSHMPGFENSHVIGLADDLGVRASRWIDGDFVFSKEMKEKPNQFKDSIGKGIVQTSKKRRDPKWKGFGVQILSEETYDIPYRCLLPKKVEGLILGSGRSVSQTNPFLLRVMAMTMVVGQGAGAAAALSAKSGSALRELDIALLQAELRKQNVNV